MLREALEKTLKAANVREDLAVEVEAVRMLADMVEERPSDDRLWREFRLGLKALRDVSEGDDDIAESIRDLLGRMGDSNIRNAEK